jgi:hypothetical protein
MSRSTANSENTVIQFSVQRMVCTGCGAEANASCNCGVSYVAKSVRAAEAIKANPRKSDRDIADEIGANQSTVSRARADLGDAYASPERVGRDGKSYPATQAPRQPPSRGRDAVRERVLEALMILSGIPPAEEVASYFAGTDTAIIVSERVGVATAWLNNFNNQWRS